MSVVFEGECQVTVGKRGRASVVSGGECQWSVGRVPVVSGGVCL